MSAIVLHGGCSRSPQSPSATTTTRSTPPTDSHASTASAAPVPASEPSDADVVRLYTEDIDKIRRAGGMRLTVTATGTQVTVMPTLHAARKEKCTPTPQAPPGWYECHLAVRLSLSPDGSAPSEQGARVALKWDKSGKWVGQ